MGRGDNYRILADDFDPDYEDAKPTNVRVFYNREWRSWGAHYIDAEGNQIGDTTWSATKDEAKKDAARMLRDIRK